MSVYNQEWKRQAKVSVEEQEGHPACMYTAMRERKRITKHLETGDGKPLTQSVQGS